VTLSQYPFSAFRDLQLGSFQQASPGTSDVHGAIAIFREDKVPVEKLSNIFSHLYSVQGSLASILHF